MNTQPAALLNRSFPSDRLTPATITAVYVFFGLGLLYASDVLLPALLTDGSLLRQLQTVKGGVEILVSGGLIYVLVDRMEGQLEQSEQRYENLVRTSPASINLFDEEGTIKWGNHAVLDLLGLDGRDRVFQSGYSSETDGTGLGLAIVRTIVEAHGWSISVTNGTKGGARFEITDVDRSEGNRSPRTTRRAQRGATPRASGCPWLRSAPGTGSGS